MRQYREARAVLHTAMSDRRVPRVCPACSRVFPRVPACSCVEMRGHPFLGVCERCRLVNMSAGRFWSL